MQMIVCSRLQIKFLKAELNFSNNVSQNHRLKSQTDKIQIIPCVRHCTFTVEHSPFVLSFHSRLSVFTSS